MKRHKSCHGIVHNKQLSVCCCEEGNAIIASICVFPLVFLSHPTLCLSYRYFDHFCLKGHAWASKKPARSAKPGQLSSNWSAACTHCKNWDGLNNRNICDIFDPDDGSTLSDFVFVILMVFGRQNYKDSKVVSYCHIYNIYLHANDISVLCALDEKQLHDMLSAKACDDLALLFMLQRSMFSISKNTNLKQFCRSIIRMPILMIVERTLYFCSPLRPSQCFGMWKYRIVSWSSLTQPRLQSLGKTMVWFRLGSFFGGGHSCSTVRRSFPKFTFQFHSRTCLAWKGFTETNRRRYTGQKPGTKSIRRPADKSRIHRGSIGHFVPPAVYIGFPLFVLLKSRSGQLSSMPWRARETVVSWAKGPVGVPSYPAPFRPAAPPCAAHGMSGFWDRQLANAAKCSKNHRQYTIFAFVRSMLLGDHPDIP